MRDYESNEAAYYGIKDATQRSRVHSVVKRALKNDKTVYILTIDGNGAYDKYRDITWHQESRMEEKNGLLYILDTTCRISDKKGAFIASYEKIFNYGNRKIYWRQKNPDGTVRKEITFPLREKTTDDISMIYFLKPFAAKYQQSGFQDFYLITNEPKMYKTRITFIRRESLKLPSAEKKAIKFKLTGDVGIIDDILDRFVPHTYIWYEEETPFDWLQYEGFETDMHSAYVRARIEKRQAGSP
jgi:hypothetical protein